MGCSGSSAKGLKRPASTRKPGHEPEICRSKTQVALGNLQGGNDHEKAQGVRTEILVVLKSAGMNENGEMNFGQNLNLNAQRGGIYVQNGRLVIKGENDLFGNSDGLIKYQSGATYRGELNGNGQKHGKGIYLYSDGREYKGEFEYDKKEGIGQLKWPSGAEYIGQFKNDRINGKGLKITAAGNIYEGEFVNDEMCGEGVYFWAGSQQLHIGEFRNNRNDGKGLHLWPNGQKYKGDYYNWRRHGFGQNLYTNGDVYIGQWQEDKRHGEGLLIKSNGELVVGDWENGELCFIHTNAKPRMLAITG